VSATVRAARDGGASGRAPAHPSASAGDAVGGSQQAAPVAVERAERRAPSREFDTPDVELPTTDERGVPALVKAEPKLSPAAEDYIRTNLDRSIGKDVDANKQFIAAARASAKGEKGVFIELDVSKLKQLNDEFRSKDRITSFVNDFQYIFSEKVESKIKALVAKRPDLKESLEGFLRSGDYKDLRYGKLKVEGPPELIVVLQEAIDESIPKFTKKISDLGLIRSTDMQPVEWFEVGVGRSADEATAAARAARDDKGPPRVTQYHEVRPRFEKALSDVHAANEKMVGEIGDSQLMKRTANGKMQLTDFAWEILRKSKNEDELISAVEKRFGKTISRETASNMLAYKRDIDRFSPGLLIEERKIVSLNGAEHGGGTVDFRGLGARNMAATENALLDAKDADEAIRLARANEEKVTKEFEAMKERYRQIIKSECTGDDCVDIATKPKSIAEKQAEIAGLAAEPHPGAYRRAFINDGVPSHLRSELAVHGEGIEKVLRSQLEGKIPLERLEQLTFGVDMRLAKGATQLGDGSVGLVLGQGRRVKLTSDEIKLIEKSFNEAVTKFNREMNDEFRRAGRTDNPIRYRTDQSPLGMFKRESPNRVYARFVRAVGEGVQLEIAA
jgi:hypothetical protein